MSWLSGLGLRMEKGLFRRGFTSRDLADLKPKFYPKSLNGLFKLLAEGLELFKLLEAEANCKIDCAVS